MDWLGGDDRRGGSGRRLRLRVGLFLALELLSTVIRTPSSSTLLLPLLVWRNEAIIHSVWHAHLLEPRLARHKATRRYHPHSPSHLGHQRHLVHHHLLKYQRVRHLSSHSCIHIGPWKHSVRKYWRHGYLRLLLLLGESRATGPHSFEKTSTWVSTTLTVATITKHCTRARRKIGTTRLVWPMGGRGSRPLSSGRQRLTHGLVMHRSRLTALPAWRRPISCN